MQIRWKRWLMAIVVLSLLAGWYVGTSAVARSYINWLAGQPSVQTAFDEEGGSTDALIVLITFMFLTPVAASIILMLVVFIVKVFELVLFRLHLPEWTSTPVVLLVLGFASYTVREAWLPHSLYALGLLARAYLVYRAGVTSLPH